MQFSKSHQVKRMLLRAIMEGQFRYVDHIPSISSLSHFFGVSIATVQQAVHMLAADGILEPVPGKGLLVRPFAYKKTDSKKIGLVVAQDPAYLRSKPYPSGVLDPFRDELDRAGYTIVPCNLKDMDEMAVPKKLQGLKLAALALFEFHSDFLIADMQELRLPMVSLDYDAYRLGVSSVVFDNRYGAFQATRHLVEKGHRRIAFLRPLDRMRVGFHLSLDPVVAERMQGYQLAMQDAGLPPQIEEFEQTRKLMRHKLHEILARSHAAPTAMLCPGDALAKGVIEEARAYGVRVPDDLSIVGFGDFKVEFEPGHTITSVRVDMESMAKTAARLLLSSMSALPGRTQLQVVPARLSIHDSVAALEARSAGVSPALDNVK